MMRFGSTTVMFALLLGAAPALAQESPGILPMPQSTEKATDARAQAAKYALRRKAAPRIAAPETVAVKPVTPNAEPVKSGSPTAEAAEISA
ncbi:MAG: hypothetical protein WBE53_17090, partial [Pseudolabrys sp.]